MHQIQQEQPQVRFSIECCLPIGARANVSYSKGPEMFECQSTLEYIYIISSKKIFDELIPEGLDLQYAESSLFLCLRRSTSKVLGRQAF